MGTHDGERRCSMKITINLKDATKLCHCCGEVKPSVRSREYRSHNYQGPCGDSFCYASCRMSACRPIRVQACDECEKAQKVPEGYDAD